MNIFLAFFVLLVSSQHILGDEKVRYDDFKVYRLTPKTVQAVEALRNLEDSNSEYDFWTAVRGVGYPVDIMVAPHLKYRFNDIINSGEFDAEVYISDVQELIDNERPKTRLAGTVDWTDYNTLDEVRFLKDMFFIF
jgi:hypothetical protein